MRSVTALWSAEFARAPYVWLETGSGGRIPWTASLYDYFTDHFRLLGLVNGSPARTTSRRAVSTCAIDPDTFRAWPSGSRRVVPMRDD